MHRNLSPCLQNSHHSWPHNSSRSRSHNSNHSQPHNSSHFRLHNSSHSRPHNNSHSRLRSGIPSLITVLKSWYPVRPGMTISYHKFAKTPGALICHYRYPYSQISAPGVQKSNITWSTRSPSNPNLRSRCFYKRRLVNRLWKQVHLCNYLPRTYPSQNLLWTISPHVSKQKQMLYRAPYHNKNHSQSNCCTLEKKFEYTTGHTFNFYNCQINLTAR